jgi:hypothetical protein
VAYEAIIAATAVAGLAYTGYSGERSASAQRDAQRRQGAAQDQAEAAAARQERAAMAEQQKAAKSAPDVMAIYDREQRRGGAVGPNLTNNAGPLSLGGNSLLGG